MKLLFINIFLIAALCCRAQQVIINGNIGNRPLVWEDFKGSPDKNSSLAANTIWYLNYKYTGVVFKNDTVILTGLTIVLELDSELSWYKIFFKTTAFLKHLQGHFDIGLICQKALIKNINNTVFLKSNYDGVLKEISEKTLTEYQKMSIKYDEETEHNKNKKAQEVWNDFFKKELSSI